MPDRHRHVNVDYAYAVVARGCGGMDTARMRFLREIRTSKGLSQTALAQIVGCNQATIAKIERGEANPTLRMIEDIAKALSVSPVSLFGATAVQARALAYLDAMPEDRMDAALAVLDAMTRSPNSK